jgi:hypothetical protein
MLPQHLWISVMENLTKCTETIGLFICVSHLDHGTQLSLSDLSMHNDHY